MVSDRGRQPVRHLTSDCNGFGGWDADTIGQSHLPWLALLLSLSMSLLLTKSPTGHLYSKSEAWWTMIYWHARYCYPAVSCSSTRFLSVGPTLHFCTLPPITLPRYVNDLMLSTVLPASHLNIPSNSRVDCYLDFCLVSIDFQAERTGFILHNLQRQDKNLEYVSKQRYFICSPDLRKIQSLRVLWIFLYAFQESG